MSLSNAIYSGSCASFASMFGKLSGLELLALDEKLRLPIKILSFCLMILLNSLVWTFFVKALHKSQTTLEATAVSSAVNYIISGILGYLIFDEVMGLLWWVGITFIVLGIAIISNSSPINKQDFEKRGRELSLRHRFYRPFSGRREPPMDHCAAHLSTTHHSQKMIGGKVERNSSEARALAKSADFLQAAMKLPLHAMPHAAHATYHQHDHMYARTSSIGAPKPTEGDPLRAVDALFGRTGDPDKVHEFSLPTS